MADVITFGIEFHGKRFDDAGTGLRYFAQSLNQGAERLGPVLAKELRDYLTFVASEMSNRHGTAWPGGTTANTLSVRDGALTKSLRDGVKVEGDKLDTVRGEMRGVFYAKVHEYGAVIKVKNAKYLAIPLPAALGPTGMPLKPGPRFWTDTFVIKSKAGNLLIVQRQGGKIVPLYVLKTQVTIPQRLGLRKTVQTGLPFFQEKATEAMLKTLLADA